MILRRVVGAAIVCATLAQFHVCVAQQMGAIHLVAAMIPLAEGVRSYCDSVSPGTGAAISDAVATLKSGQDEYLAWMVKQQIYLDAQKNVAAGVAKDPRAFLQQYGPESSCENLPKTLMFLVPALRSETGSDYFKQILRSVQRYNYYLVPPGRATARVPADSAACLAEASIARPLTESERKLLEGRPTDNFVVNGKVRFGTEGFPIAFAELKPDESTALSDWYVFCLLQRGYAWLQPYKPN